MKFSPCTGECTKDGSHCQGCGRSHTEIKESSALWAKVAAHMFKYGYEDPENFLETLNKKALKRLALLQENKAK